MTKSADGRDGCGVTHACHTTRRMDPQAESGCSSESTASAAATTASTCNAPLLAGSHNTAAEAHRLGRRWRLWVLWRHSGGASYKRALRPICTFDTVEEFWKRWEAYPMPSAVFSAGGSFKLVRFKPGKNPARLNSLCCFEDGIQPEWEHSRNAAGGEWLCRCKGLSLSDLDKAWEALVLSMIGGSLDFDDGTVTGLRVVDKTKGKLGTYALEVWFGCSPASDAATVLLKSIHKQLEPVLDSVPEFTLRCHSVEA